MKKSICKSSYEELAVGLPTCGPVFRQYRRLYGSSFFDWMIIV